jgi:hypothetical protein
MKNIVHYLQSKEAVFHGSLLLIILYVPHAGHLFRTLEHLDMSVLGFTFFNWVYGLSLAVVIEFLILVFIINGYKNTGKFYAVVSFFLNVFYYDYWFISFQSPTAENVKTTLISFCICLIHSLAVWQLSELFFTRLKDEKDNPTLYCRQCEAGPFPNKRALDGHISKAHKGKKVVVHDGVQNLIKGREEDPISTSTL